jgi:hypothetical protein
MNEQDPINRDNVAPRYFTTKSGLRLRFLSGKDVCAIAKGWFRRGRRRGSRYSKFADLPPGHPNEWKRARKTLTPTKAGFEERLEFDVGSDFTPYYVISMRKLPGNSQA